MEYYILRDSELRNLYLYVAFEWREIYKNYNKE